MAQKLDKETFIKHHFWFLLGLLVPLIFLALILLWTGTAGAIDENQTKLDNAKKALEAIPKSNPTNTHWMEVLDKKGKQAAEQRDKLWKDMWALQAAMMTWPPHLADKMKNAYFGDKIDIRDRTVYAQASEYPTQLEDVVAVVDPVRPNGEGAVQCGTGDWGSFIQHVTQWANEAPSTEDIWLEQESLWLQREMLRIIRTANDNVAEMKPVPLAPGPGKASDESDRKAFANSGWRIEVGLASALAQPALRCRLTNIDHRRQTLGVSFRIGLKGTTATETIYIDGEPLAPQASIDKVWPLSLGPQLANAEGLESARQVFDWRTAPVKRVDQMRITWHSARTAGRAFVAYPFPQLEGDPTQGGAPRGDWTEQRFQRKRYLEVTPQVRRLAVAMLLVVDQNHMQDVLTAFANSRLRITTNEWHWQRYSGEIRPKNLEAPVVRRVRPSTPNAPPMPTQPVAGAAGGGGDEEDLEGEMLGGRRRRAGAKPAAAVAAAAAAAASSAGDDQEFELVQLAVYGVASLYERYPPKAGVPAPVAQPAKEKKKKKKADED